jgi:hypothetical protein
MHRNEGTGSRTAMADAQFAVRLVFEVGGDSARRRVGYLYPATGFAVGEQAERYGVCLWAARHRNVVAVQVFPPVAGRAVSPDGWSIAEPVHVDCRSVERGPVVAVVSTGDAAWWQDASVRVGAGSVPAAACPRIAEVQAPRAKSPRFVTEAEPPGE